MRNADNTWWVTAREYKYCQIKKALREILELFFMKSCRLGTIFGSNPVAPTFSEEITYNQKKNRLLLLIAAAQAGLVNYSYEWWHF